MNWRGTRLDTMSRSDLIAAILMLQTELDDERSGKAFRDKVLSRIRPIPEPIDDIPPLHGIKLVGPNWKRKATA